MKTIKKLDNMGRLHLPKKIRETINIDANDLVEITYERNHIIIKRAIPQCALCGTEENLLDTHDDEDAGTLCYDCAIKIKNLLNMSKKGK